MKKYFLVISILVFLLMGNDIFSQGQQNVREIKAPPYKIETSHATTDKIIFMDPTTRVISEETISNFLLGIYASPTFTTSMTGYFLTASEILGTNASKQIVSLPVATYPSLTELSYVKGVTSSIQTQISTKLTAPTVVSKVYWGAAGVVQSDSVGTNTTPTAGTRYWVELTIPAPVTLSGISYLVGSTGGTDSIYCWLYNSSGTLVAQTDMALVGTAQQIQSCSFSSSYSAIAGVYYVAVQFNGNTARFMTYGVTGAKFVAGSATGTAGVAADITPGTTYTADKAPFVSTW